jgi:hypothetical protein
MKLKRAQGIDLSIIINFHLFSEKRRFPGFEYSCGTCQCSQTRGDNRIRTSRNRKLEENNKTIYYYHDADVVVKMTLGILQFIDSRYQGSETQFCVRSLLATGYLGRIRMLRPHVLELDEQIRYQSSSHIALQIYAEQVRKYLREQGIEQYMSRLHKIISSTIEEHEKIENF